MDGELSVKVADCSCEKLVRIAEQCGFDVVEGRKHCKVKTLEGRFVTTIPRHKRLKRETVKGIIDAFNALGAKVSYS